VCRLLRTRNSRQTPEIRKALLRPKTASEKPWTSRLWIYDFRTNRHFTLKTNPLKRSALDDFVACYHAENRHVRKETDQFKCLNYLSVTGSTSRLKIVGGAAGGFAAQRRATVFRA
jgi:hypothetical protein